jgi:hypothetical protein
MGNRKENNLMCDNINNKLMNINEEIPKEFYVFVNLDNPITKHNLEITKGFTSGAIGNIINMKKYLDGTMDYLPFIPNPNQDHGPLSMFQWNITSDYRAEYNCEIFRKEHCPLFPSRLSAIYAFGDFETCKKVSATYSDWDINNVRKFSLEPIPFTRVVKVNMEIISLMRGADTRCSLDQNAHNTIWNSYWRGDGNIQLELPSLTWEREIRNSGIIWEYLIEGRLKLIEE